MKARLRRFRKAALRLGQVVFIGALLVGRAIPSTRPVAVAVFIAGAVITAAAIRGADQ